MTNDAEEGKCEYDAYIETHYWPAKRGHPRPTLVITYESLLAMLCEEEGVLDPDDAPALCRAIAWRVAGNQGSDPRAVAAWVALANDDGADRDDEESADDADG